MLSFIITVNINFNLSLNLYIYIKDVKNKQNSNINNNNNDKSNTKATNHNDNPHKFPNLLKTDIQNINNSIYSEHNMINISDILYFFSKDIDKERLINVFSEKKATIPKPDNSTLLKLVKYIDEKYSNQSTAERNCCHTKNNSSMEFRKYIDDINHEYIIKSGGKNKYAGWNYYEENKDFIKKFFKEDDRTKEKLVDKTSR